MLNWNIHSHHKYQPTDSAMSAAWKLYNDTLQSPDIGFFHLPKNTELIAASKQVYEAFKHKKYFIHVGIGGSALGPDMLLKALGTT